MSGAFRPTTKAELQQAVNSWCDGTYSFTSNDITYDITNLGSVDTQDITDMSTLFRNKATCNPDISSWDTSNVVDMSQAFQFARSFNQDVRMST